MKIVIFFHEPPLPAIHGGRVDVWRRIKALAGLGHHIALVCWAKPSLGTSPENHAWLLDVRRYVSELIVLRTAAGLGDQISRVLRLRHCSWDMASRIPSRSECRDTVAAIARFRPDWVWQESLYGGWLAQHVARTLSVPLIYRSHNIEHKYMRGQAELLRGAARRAKGRLSLLHLEEIERETVSSACAVFDISVDDLEFWRASGLQRGYWLPTNVELGIEEQWARADAAPDSDVAFMGNLSTPNNVEAVSWLIREVMPQLRRSRPNASLIVAGSNPVNEIVSLVRSCRGAELLANPPDPMRVLTRGRVIVNPARSGSGLNVKSVEMLFARRARVSTSQGVAGLPTEVKKAFAVSDTAVGFAQNIESALDGECADQALVERARSHFRPEAVAAALDFARLPG